MENAAKVVIIAGAILIVLVVISIAVLVTLSGNKTLEDAGNIAIDNATRTSQVNKFVKYNGTGITGAQVKQCISAAIAHNSNIDNINFAVSVSVGGTAYVNKAIGNSRAVVVDDMSDNILNNNTYTGTVHYLDGVGTIDTITFN